MDGIGAFSWCQLHGRNTCSRSLEPLLKKQQLEINGENCLQITALVPRTQRRDSFAGMPTTGPEMTWSGWREDLPSSLSCSWEDIKETWGIYLDLKKKEKKKNKSYSSKGRKGYQNLLCPRAYWRPFKG